MVVLVGVSIEVEVVAVFCAGGTFAGARFDCG